MNKERSAMGAWIRGVFYLAILLLVPYTGFAQPPNSPERILEPNILDYSGDPDNAKYRKSLAFSDQGAWFAYGHPDERKNFGGFVGPFLMTQENGVWSSAALSKLVLTKLGSNKPTEWISTKKLSYGSSLVRIYRNRELKITQTLFFGSAHTAIITTFIENKSDQTISFVPSWKGNSLVKNLRFHRGRKSIKIRSSKSTAVGEIRTDKIEKIQLTPTSYEIELKKLTLNRGGVRKLLLFHTFIFPEYDARKETKLIKKIRKESPNFSLRKRIVEKTNQLVHIFKSIRPGWDKPKYRTLIAKAVLTLQNNWRIPAGELKHGGVFPSYHYVWFHGFWAWDSWKHSVALARFNPNLAKNQIRAMYDFMDDKGFIADVVYRDTSIEKHNLRNTKPPLSGWAIWKVYEQDKNLSFLKEVYPKLLKQHRWWYLNRDHDQDGVCEYGSTDGTLKAAKWESGMDNAVRFDDSKTLKNSKSAYSLDQESVDLNAYLYAEKRFLTKIAGALKKTEDAITFDKEAKELKTKIQNQFFDTKSGWFYDTSLDGKRFVKAMGCEGWIPLWAGAATKKTGCCC